MNSVDLPPPDCPTSPTRWPGWRRRLNRSKIFSPPGIAEGDVVVCDRGAALHQRLGLGVIAQLVRHQQRGDRLGQPCDVLGDVDQRHCEIARGAQDGDAKRTDQYDVTGRRLALLPERDRPGHQRNRQKHGYSGMQQPQLFQITQAAASRGQLLVHRRVEPLMLVADPAEGAHQRHVADDVDHFAVDHRRLVGEIVMQRLAGGCQTKHRNHHAAGDHDQPERHVRTDGSNQGNCRNCGYAGRQHVPDKHVFDGEHRVRRRRDTARQHAGHPVREVARRMSGQMTKYVTA
ncbi:hypothetical protein ACVIIV_006825 [Bradyrhizobium sp. USDA 4354]